MYILLLCPFPDQPQIVLRAVTNKGKDKSHGILIIVCNAKHCISKNNSLLFAPLKLKEHQRRNPKKKEKNAVHRDQSINPKEKRKRTVGRKQQPANGSNMGITETCLAL